MTGPESTRERVDELLRRRGPLEDGGVGPALGRLCHCVSEDLGLAGSAATLMSTVDSHTVPAASSDVARHLEEAQFGTGEGPSRDAFAARRPVLVADLEDAGTARWPGWAPVALEAGVSRAYALPLHLGATIFGTLTLYADHGTSLAGHRLETAFVFGEVATEILLDTAAPGSRQPWTSDLDAALDMHSHVYQAQGMVMVQLGVTLPEALSRMRAHAWVAGRDLTAVAGDIVAGKVVLPLDDR